MLRLDDTGFGELKIWQDTKTFCYGIDAVLLSAFAGNYISKVISKRKNSHSLEINKKNYRLCDLGTGNGIIPLLLTHKTEVEEIWGLEIQKTSLKLAVKTAIENHLEERLKFIEGDVTVFSEISRLKNMINFSEDKEAILNLLRKEETLLKTMGGRGTFDAITMNPPYTKADNGIKGKCESKIIARHEVKGNLENFLEAASTLLKPGGSLFLVHRPFRLVDIFEFCRRRDLEPKVCRFVLGKPETSPNLVLLHFVKGGNAELEILPNLSVRNEVGEYTDEILEIYERVH